MSEIKNCPFCGAVSDASDGGEFHFFHVPGCFLFGQNWVRGLGFRRWNSRVLPPEVERLVKIADRFCEQDERWLRSQVENLPNHMPAMRDRFLELIDALAALKGK